MYQTYQDKNEITASVGYSVIYPITIDTTKLKQFLLNRNNRTLVPTITHLIFRIMAIQVIPVYQHIVTV